MKQFETYLINIGIHFKGAARYDKVAVKYLNWVEENKLNVTEVKRSQFTDWLQTYREQGFKQSTLNLKENIIRHYYRFLGTKNNPAESWMERTEESTLPPIPIEKSDLVKIYETLEPVKLIDYRNRCMLGFVLFQALKRNELEEMRITDVDFKTGTVFVQGQMRSNSRRLKLEPVQILDLHEYVKEHRKKLLVNKKEDSDQFFLSHGYAKNIENPIKQILKKAQRLNPQVKNLYHIRTSVITHWRNEHGLMEAMIMCGHKHAASTRRYETKKYDALHEQLKKFHPLEMF
ncbi:MAG: site-specific integrase [Bacteroidota bacterium]|nr:site-specific integrase [Bacteroidota bacterium]